MTDAEHAAENQRRFGIRLNELGEWLGGRRPSDEFPEWVRRLGKKLWVDLTPKGAPVPSEEDLPMFINGFLLGAATSGPIANLPSEDVIEDGQKRADRAGEGAEYSLAMENLRQGQPFIEAFPKDAWSEVVLNLISLPHLKRIPFAHGLTLGARLVHEVQNNLSSRGGSTRQTVMLVLWLNWPQLDEYESVAEIYRNLEYYFGRDGKSNLLGDWERFKKVAQEIRLKPRKKRKGKP